MDKIKRYDLVGEYSHHIGEVQDGDYVAYSDYEELLSVVDELIKPWKDQKDTQYLPMGIRKGLSLIKKITG